MTLDKYERRLKTVLYRKGIILGNRPEKYNEVIKRLGFNDITKGIKANPRLLGPTIVLLVQHPKIFEKLHLLPRDMIDTVEALKRGAIEGPDCRYEKYEKLFQLCTISNDGRVKGVQKKIRKNFRFENTVIKKLHQLMKEKNFKTETETLENLIFQECNKLGLS